MNVITSSLRRQYALITVLFAAIAIITFAVYRHVYESAMLPSLFVQIQDSPQIVRFSHDGKFLMTVDTDDHLVTFRDAESGKIVRQWPGGAAYCWLSDDGQRFLEADPSLKGPTHCTLRDAVTGKALRQWTGMILDVLPDLSRMAVADDYHFDLPAHHIRLPTTGRVVEVATGRVDGNFAVSDLWDVHMYQSGYMCLTGGNEPSQLLRLPGLAPVLHLPVLGSMVVSRDGGRVVGLSGDGTLHIWLLPSGRHTAIATGLDHARLAYQVADGNIVIDGYAGTGANARDVIQLRSADGTHLIRTLPISANAYSPDGVALASKYFDRNTASCYDVFNVSDGRRVARLDTSRDILGQPLSQNTPGFEHFAIAPGGLRFAYVSAGGLLRLYDLSGSRSSAPSPLVSTDAGRTVLSFPGSQYGANVFDAVSLSGGGVAASGGNDDRTEQRQVQVWRPGRDVLTVKAVVGNGNVSRLGISPDGVQLAGSSSWGVWTLDLANNSSTETPISVATNGTQYYSSEEEGRPVWLDGPGKPFTVISAGPFSNGPVLLTRWDAAARKIGSEILLPAEKMVNGRYYQIGAAQSSPDGKILAVLWNGVNHQMVGGKLEYGIRDDGMMELRDTRSGRLIRTLLPTQPTGGHRSYMDALGQPTFSSDCRLLAIEEDSGRIFVFEVATGHKVGQLSGTRVLKYGGQSLFNSNMFGGSAFSPDDRFLAAARDDGSIYLYSLRTFLPVAQIGQVSARTAAGYPELPHPLRWMAFDSRGGTLYGVAQNGSDVLAWDVPNVSDAPPT